MPASLLPCANCHGHDGLGRPEGGAEPSDITWSNLTKSYGHRHKMGREHPAFDEESLAKAIAKRVDPASNPLDLIMPRYEMSEGDMAALIAYIKRLERDLDPGLSDDTIRLGSILPSQGPYGALGQAVAATLRAYFDEVNAAGGIYGRKVELKVAEYVGGKDSTAANARRLVEQDRVFAVLGAFTLGMERELFPIFEGGGVPQVGPVTLFAGHDELQNDSAFFVLSGLSDQARALVDYAALHLDPAPTAVAVVLAQHDIYDDIARAVERQAERRGWPRPAVVRVAGGRDGAARRVEELSRSGAEAVFYFGPAEGLPGFAAEAAARDWRPRLLLSGLIAGRQALDLPAAFQGGLFLAYPNLPRDQSPKGADAFRALHEKHGLPREHLAAQVEAYAAAKVLVEALRRSGRALSRGGLVAALEGLSKFDTGQTPPVSFGPTRRVGALGAHVVSIDPETKRFLPGATWVPLD
jgi:ABC-type branched-subunit amino acid transport system substrate-binding protein